MYIYSHIYLYVYVNVYILPERRADGGRTVGGQHRTADGGRTGGRTDGEWRTDSGQMSDGGWTDAGQQMRLCPTLFLFCLTSISERRSCWV